MYSDIFSEYQPGPRAIIPYKRNQVLGIDKTPIILNDFTLVGSGSEWRVLGVCGIHESYFKSS